MWFLGTTWYNENMVNDKQWKISIILVLIGFSTYSLIALAEVFSPLFKFFALDYSISIFIGFLIIFSIYDFFLLYFYFLFFKSLTTSQKSIGSSIRFVFTGIIISIIIKCFYMFYYLYQWDFLPALFSDTWLILSDLSTYIPIIFFFYYFHWRLKNLENWRRKLPGLLAFWGSLVIVIINGFTLLSLLIPEIFSWFYKIEFTVFITLPRLLSFFSFLYFFFTFLKVKSGIKT